MKKSLTAIAFALPLLAVSTVSLAEYQMRIGMETPQGGSLPKGSISFGNGGDVTAPVEPSEPTEPAIPDPFEPENPACDPFAVGYPGNSTGKDLLYGMWFQDKAINFEYRSCKLKPVQKPKLLTRIAYFIPSQRDECNPSKLVIRSSMVKPACEVNAYYFNYFYQVSSGQSGANIYKNYTVRVNIGFNWPFKISDIDRIVVDGSVCNNIRFFKHPMTGTVSNDYVCDTNLSYEELASKMNKQIMVEIYGK